MELTANTLLTDQLGELEKASYLLWSKAFSMHEVITYLGEKLAPCSLMLTTFSIGEESCRAFELLKRHGFLKDLRILMDGSARANKIASLLFLENVGAEIYLKANHSKVTLIESAKGCWSILASANLTVNPRLEHFYITRSKKIYRHLKEQFENEIQSSERYALLRGTT